MERYRNLSGDSGVRHYAIGEDFIEVMFEDNPTIYIYNYSINGEHHIEKMKSLARSGKGLCTYITEHKDVKKHYNKRYN